MWTLNQDNQVYNQIGITILDPLLEDYSYIETTPLV